MAGFNQLYKKKWFLAKKKKKKSKKCKKMQKNASKARRWVPLLPEYEKLWIKFM